LNLFLLVIDGLGMWNDKHCSTFHFLENHYNIDTATEFPTLAELGIDKAKAGIGNLLLQKSIGVGSLEGHREMLGYVSNSTYTILSDGIPTTILQTAEKDFPFHCIGNIQGRGQQIIHKFWEQHKKERSLIIYSGFDYTVSMAFEQGLLENNSVQDFAKRLMIALQENGIPIRKFIIREFKGSPKVKVSEKELFYPIDFDSTINHLGFNSFVVNNKIQDIFDFSNARVFVTDSDNDCFKCLDNISCSSSNYFFFLNLGDFDYNAHIGNIDGCLKVLQNADLNLFKLRKCMNESDFLIITSDHGVRYGESDLYFSHLRECTLLLVSNGNSIYYHPGVAQGHGLILDLLHHICNSQDLSILGFYKLEG